LRIAGSNGERIFDSSALLEIHRFSGGIPRIVNLICEHCLVAAFADHKKQVSKNVVEVVARDFALNDTSPSTIATAVAEAPALSKPELVEALKTVSSRLTNFDKETALVGKLDS
jgi:hypothetical protein